MSTAAPSVSSSAAQRGGAKVPGSVAMSQLYPRDSALSDPCRVAACPYAGGTLLERKARRQEGAHRREAARGGRLRRPGAGRRPEKRERTTGLEPVTLSLGS